MPICLSCGAASVGAAATCANCGGQLAAPAIGEVVEDTGTGPAGPSPWGAGRVHHGRDLPLPSRGWLTAGRVLLAPTGLLVLAAVIGAGSGDGDGSPLFESSWSAEGFQAWLALVLTAFGAPVRLVMTATGPRADGPASGLSSSSHLVMYLVTLGWLLALWLGLRVSARARRRDGATEPTGPAAGLQALRTGVLSALVALLLGWLAGYDTDAAATPSLRIETGPELLPLTASAGLAAAVLVLAVDGAAALRAEAARRGWLGSLLLAWQHAFRVLGGLLALLTAVALVAQLVSDDVFPDSASLGLVTNNGLLLFGVGGGATLLTADSFGLGHRAMSLFDLDGHGGGWWFAVLLPLAAALALGWSAHRGRLAQRDRAVLAGLYAVLTGALLLGTSIWSTLGGKRDEVAGIVLDSRDTLGWSLLSVLVSALAWGAAGALLVPAVLDAARRTPAPLVPAPPHPAAGPAVPPVPAGPPVLPVLPAQAGADRFGAVPHGSVELVSDELPAPAAPVPAPTAAGSDPHADPHAAYRRPDTAR
ncbi:hypothetical protein [Kitasatospora fiedleri]|uniref:hypothetical protein n=1 Tax=Kitasatospora fiedleri TaxID=2991545 RepID=UPI00249B8796|nr:hypothetical protein [Kitasatospora fiedleri]